MPGYPEVGGDEFRTAVKPFATMVEDVAAAGYAATHASQRDSQQDPAQGSPADTEHAEQDRYSGVWDDTPIDTATSHTCLLLTAGEDAMRTFATAIFAERTPLYAYVPLARCALEYLGLAHWLGDPGVDARERVRRSLNERIASAVEQAKLPRELNPEPDRQQRLLEAAILGYQITKAGRRRFKHFAPEMPTITAHVKRVLGSDDLGKVLYAYTSAISHGTMWGLMARADAPAVITSPVVRVGLAISSADIGHLAAALVMAHFRAYGGFVSYMGWDEPAWRSAIVGAREVIDRLLGQAAQPPPASEWGQATPGGLWLPEPRA